MIVEDGTGIADANSYVTLEEAETYFQTKGVGACHITESDLIAATEYIDLAYGDVYMGRLYSNEQGLLFPRTGFYDRNTRQVEEGTIPKELKRAVFYAAKLKSEGTDLITSKDRESNIKTITQGVSGAVSQSKTYFDRGQENTAFIGGVIYPIIGDFYDKVKV